MANEGTKKLEGTIPKTILESETNLMRKRIAEIQEDIKNRLGDLPTDFNEKAFMDEGWEC